MKYSLFIDDERNPEDVTWMDLSEIWKHPVTIARSMEQVEDIVRNVGFPAFISFDHDLGEKEPTGKDIANWLIGCDLDNDSMPSDFSYCVHSKNPVGKENIQGLLDSYLLFKEHQ